MAQLPVPHRGHRLTLRRAPENFHDDRASPLDLLTETAHNSRSWPALVPAPVFECLTGRPRRDAQANRFLQSCDVVTELSQALARRCARLRFEARRGSAVDAIAVGLAEPAGVVVTSDPADIEVLADAATGVTVRPV